MTAPDPQAIRAAADRAETLPTLLRHSQNSYVTRMSDGFNSIIVRSKDDELVECYRLMQEAADALSVLVPAARTAADLLDAIGDPEALRTLSDLLGEFRWASDAAKLRRIADAAAAARGEQADG